MNEQGTCMKKEKRNYLDYIPGQSEQITWEKKENGLIVIKVQHTGLFNCIAQFIFHKPKFSYVDLDVFGSFVWTQIDGKKTIYEIGQAVKSEFGEKAEPLYERLARFIVILRNNGYVVYLI